MSTANQVTDIGSAVLEWLSKQDRIDLEHILQPTERVVFATGGSVLRPGHLAFSGWRIVVTSERVLCVRGRGLMSRQLIEVPNRDVKTVHVKGLFFASYVVLGSRQGILRIGGMPNVAVRQLAAAIEIAADMNPFDGDRTVLPQRRSVAAVSGFSPRIEQLETAVERLETQIASMQEQIEFLEALLTARGESVRSS